MWDGISEKSMCNSASIQAIGVRARVCAWEWTKEEEKKKQQELACTDYPEVKNVRQSSETNTRTTLIGRKPNQRLDGRK